MHTIQAIAAVLAAMPLAEAAPALNGFTVAQKFLGKHKFLSGPMAVEATHLKYNKPVPADVQEAARKAAGTQGSVTASPQQYDEEYLCPVSIGTPAQTLMMDFDTGSSDLWVFSSEQSSSQSAGHTIYTPGSSSTSQQQSGETWSISYGDGSGASGNVFADKVVIGGVTATSQAVEAATSVSSQFSQNTASDGLVGLAFDSLNTVKPNKAPTFFNTVSGSLSSPLFAANLRHGQPGSYDFGYIDSSKYTGSIAYTPVNTGKGFWEFTATGYSVGSKAVSTSLDVIADTGTSLIYLPASVVSNYWSQVSGARRGLFSGGYIFPCSAKLPDLSITIGGASHTVPGSYLNYAPYQGANCFGGLQSSASLGINILGDVFLKSQYVVFDGGNTRIGFAQQA